MFLPSLDKRLAEAVVKGLLRGADFQIKAAEIKTQEAGERTKQKLAGSGDGQLFSGTDDHLTFLTISINFSVSIVVQSGLSAEVMNGQMPDVITFPSTTTPLPE